MARTAPHRTRPTVFRILRTLAPWRTRTRLGRFTAMLLALLMSVLMLGAAGPVYAEDAAPDTATTTDPAAAETTPTAAEPDPAPAEQPAAVPAPADAPAATEQPATTTPAPESSTPSSSTATTTTTTKTTTTRTSSLTALTALAPATPSWIWRGSAAIQTDGIGDSGGYTNGASEGDNPSGWNGGNSPSPKNDIDKYYFNVDTSSGDVVASFGFTRASTNGDTGFSAEFNQAGNAAPGTGNAPRPNRTEGDLLLKFFQDSGSTPLAFSHAYLWTPKATFGSYPLGCKEITGTGAGWCEIPKSGFSGRTADTGFTAEGKVDLTTLFGAGAGCSAEFHQVNLRSTASSENWTNAMQDYISPIGQTIPSTCATLVIRKLEKGTTEPLLAGAHFDVYSGATATGTPLLSDVYDGKAGVDTDSVAGQVTLTEIEPGTYTVKETVQPTGFFLPTGSDQVQTLTVAKSATATFTFYDVRQWQDLTVAKTATPSYSARYAWSIDKQVATSADGPWTDTGSGVDAARIADPSGSGTFFYRVAVRPGAKTGSDYRVTGAIRVKNPNSRPVQVTLSDSLPGATCTIPGGTSVSVAGDGAFHDYAYTCTFAGTPTQAQLVGTNTAGVSWSKQDYPQSLADHVAGGSYTKSATAGYDFTTDAAETSSTDRTVHVTDTKHDFTPNPYAVTWNAAGTATELTYSRTLTAAAGTCTTDRNTATITETQQSDSADATVCRGADLVVRKGATASLVRTYPWTIQKSTSTPRVDVDGQGKATASYSVTVTAGDAQDSAWHMSGSVTVENPNDWQSVSLTGLTDVYSGGGSCSITGVRSGGSVVPVSFPYAVPAGATREFTYDCTFAGKPSTYTGTNTATATWSAAAAATPNGSASGSYTLKDGDTETALSATNDWAKTLVNGSVTVTDDHATPGNTGDDRTWDLSWSDVRALPDHRTTLTYTIDLAAPTAGTCADRVNTARVNGTNGALLGADDATVKVCNPLTLTGTKTAAPSFTRTYGWDVQKQVRVSPDGDWQDVSATWTGDAFSHDFDYRIKVARAGSTDSAWKMSGAITVTNPNTDSDIAPITATVSEPATLGGAGASCVIDSPDPWVIDGASVPVTLASGASVTLPYTCDLAAAPAAGTRNVATISWGTAAGQSTTVQSPAGGVSYTAPTTEVNETVTVVDDAATLSPLDDTSFGPLSWDDAVTPVTYGPYTLTHTATRTGCSTENTWTNTATLFRAGSATVLDTDTAKAAICPQPGTWTIAKSSATDGQQVPVGSQVTFELSATRTGGVDPTGVVVVDDLSDVVSHTGDPVLPASLPGGQTATYDASTQLLTWTIPTLSGTEKLAYSVTVDADAWNVVIRNVATSDGSTNCPDVEAAGDECRTEQTTPKQPRLTLVKQVDNEGTDGTATSADWTVSAAEDGTRVLSGAGTASGAVDPGTYDLSEAATQDANDAPVGYTTDGTWSCVNNRGGDAEAFTVDDEDSVTLAPDADVTCTITNLAQRQEWTLAKSSSVDPDPLLPVPAPGLITYTLTVTHTGGVVPTGVTVDDDLSKVLDHATLIGSSFSVDGGDPTDAAGAGVVVDGDTLTWSAGTVATSRTLSYTVQIDEDAWNTTFVNVATPESPGGSCVSEDGCTTTNQTPRKPVLTLVKDVQGNRQTGGTAVPADWTLTGDQVGGSDGLSGDGRASKAVLPGSYDLSEAAADDEDGAPLGYTSTGRWSCVSNEGGDATAYSLDEAKDTVTLAPNADVTCTIVNLAQAPVWTLAKSSDPATGATVRPGDTVTYTLTATHTGGVVPTDLTITDDLSDVLDDATFGQVLGQPLPAGQSVTGPSGDPASLVWKIDALSGTATLRYTVTVDADAAGAQLTNVVTAPGSDCPPATSSETESPDSSEQAAPAKCTTTHPVPRWTLDKDSDPASGELVEPGQAITYTLTVANTSAAELAGATVVDDLSKVLDNATLDETSFLVDGVAPAAGDVTVDGTTLTWKVPTLAAGADPVTLTYTVTVGSELAVGTTFVNVAAPGSAVDNPVNGTGSCVAEGECSTQQGTAVVEPPVVEPPVVEPPVVQPPVVSPPQAGPTPTTSTLPNTGGPQGWFVPGGAALLLVGAGLVLADRRRRQAA